MIIKDVNIGGTIYLCQLTLDEKRRMDAGHSVDIPAKRRVKKRLGIAPAAQAKAAGFAAPPVIFFFEPGTLKSYPAAGVHQSSQDLSFSGHTTIAENGTLLSNRVF